MNRQEALIEIMKGNVVENRHSGKIYAQNLDSGCPVFVFELSNGNTQDLNDGLNNGCEPFELVPKTRTIEIDGKTIEISEESFQELKKKLLEE